MQLSDLLGLNTCEIDDMVVVGSKARTRSMYAAAKASGGQIAVAGARHAQGGQAVLGGGTVAVTEPFNRVHSVQKAPADDPWPWEYTVDAGAAWTHVHFALNTYGLAPLVHQSSAHFSVGGSLSVNCHGRDARAGVIASTVKSIVVLCGDGVERQASRTVNTSLFVAALGGYGACGMILEATLWARSNCLLEQVGWNCSIPRYAAHAHEILAGNREAANIQMHYGWVNCTPDRFFEEVLAVDYKVNDALRVAAPLLGSPVPLVEEQWGMTELLTAAWGAARTNPDMKREAWKLVREQIAMPRRVNTRLDWMRSQVSFTSHAATTHVDILQEYFVPAAALTGYLSALRSILLKHSVNVLSCTLRLVPRDPLTTLSYARTEDVVSIALDVNVPVRADALGRPATPEAEPWVLACVDSAIERDGSFYLPYYCFPALRSRVDVAYPQLSAHAAATAAYNPDRVYWNNFLEWLYG